MWVEAAIDFPEEEIDFLADRGLADRMRDLRARFVRLDDAARQGALLRDGLTLVIAGRPNAGKSSLLNRLAGYDAAIVTAAPGTTRDVLRERIEIDGMPVHVLDTAGLRASADEVEREGIRRAEREIARADRVLFVVDASDRDRGCRSEERPRAASGRHSCDGGDEQGRPHAVAGHATRRVSRRGCTCPRRPVRAWTSFACTSSNAPAIRHRAVARSAHGAGTSMHCAARALTSKRRERLLLERRAGELVAQELADAQQALGEITGEVSSDELLGRIFASFCIGK